MAKWHDKNSVSAEWAGAPTGAELDSLLAVARETICEFLNVDDPGAGDIPERWRLAQRLQAQALWQANKASPTDEMGFGSNSVNLYPMDAKIRRLLAPARLLPGIG